MEGGHFFFFFDGNPSNTHQTSPKQGEPWNTRGFFTPLLVPLFCMGPSLTRTLTDLNMWIPPRSSEEVAGDEEGGRLKLKKEKGREKGTCPRIGISFHFI
jgi:hypothetical protein